MADSGQIKALVGGLASDVKKAMIASFEYVLGDIRFGLPGHQKRATNLRVVQLNGTTHVTAGQEFSIAHGLGRVPVMVMPTMDLSVVNASFPTLTNSKAADVVRVYFTSDSTNVPFSLWIE